MTIATETPALQLVPDVSVSDAPSPRPLQRWALAALLSGTAAFYLWNLSVSQWGNAFYSAAVQAGSQSWKAFLFGSSDAANSITVDKPPMSLWPMELSARIFGLNSWSVLVPQVLMGVASVALLWDVVRRRFGETAGLIAGLVLALTPIAVAIFRYNNPDALLVLLMVAAVWAVLRAVDDGRSRWLVLAGVLVGLAYLTKQLQIALILPALASTYLLAGPPRLRSRVWQLLLGLGAAVVAAGWWVALVQLWPARERPWIGGTQHNSILELTLGYNGLGRLNGDEPGSTSGLALSTANGPTGSHNAAPMWGETGIDRLFQPTQIGCIAWLLPAALIFLVVLLIWRRRAPRTDPQRAYTVVWGGWLVCTALVFSYMQGIFHPYYTVALAPAIAALVGAGSVVCWRNRGRLWVQATLLAAVLTTAGTGYVILRHVRLYYPWLRWVLLAAAVVLVIWVVVIWLVRAGTMWAQRKSVQSAVLVAAVILGLAGPLAYSVTTAERGNSGALPVAGPTLRSWGLLAPRLPAAARITEASGPAFLLPPGAPGRIAHVPGCSLMEAGIPAQPAVDKLKANADSFRWVAATVGSMCAAGYQLASGYSVMPIGGFNATDPAPAPDEFLRLALGHHIHYFIVSNPIEQDKWGHLTNAGLIQQWVQRNYTPTHIGRVLMYDLTS